jgi:hypothetical protein
MSSARRTRKGYALTHLSRLGGDGTGHLAFLLQPAEESVETLLQQFLPEGRVGASARQVGFGQRRKGAHEHRLWGQPV